MAQQKMTPDQVLNNLRHTINANFQNHFGPMAMPRDSFTSDNPDAIEPYDLERAKNLEFITRMRHWLIVSGMHTGRVARQLDIDVRVARQLDIDVRVVKAEARKMRLEDPATNVQLREALNAPMRRSHKQIADWFGVDEADVGQVAREMLSEDPEFLILIGEAA